MNPFGFAIAAIGIVLIVIGWRNSRGKIWNMLSGK